MKRYLFISLFFAFAYASAQNVAGKWKTTDDETGKDKSIVEIYIKDGKLYGKVIKLFKAPEEDQDPVCKVCPGDRKDKKIIGMEIIRGLKKEGIEWEGDEGILDPKTGKIYDCKLWVDEKNADILQVRGYISFLYRTQTWKRVK